MAFFRSRSSSVSSVKSEPPNMGEKEKGDKGEDVVNTERCDDSLNKMVTMTDPLGRLILEMASKQNELARKNRSVSSIINLNDICNVFVSSVEERKKVAEQTKNLDTLPNEIEKNILTKELNFAHLNQAIHPPEFASEDTNKLAEAAKIFPVRYKFTGTNRSVLEFLEDLNFCQKSLKLSQPEFLDILLRCVTSKAYQTISEFVRLGYSVDDIYLNLILQFDNRATAQSCRKEIANLFVSKSSNLIDLQNHIMYLASRISSQLPPGEARQNLYNLEGCRALINALPTNSSHIVGSNYNIMTAKLGAAPSFVQLIKTLVPHHDSINNDIRTNGKASHMNSDRRPRFHRDTRSKIFSISSTDGRSDKRNMDNNMSSQNRRPFVNNMQRNTQFRRGNKDFEGRKEGKHCSLCGASNHTASQICYKMKTDNGRICEVVPSFKHCETCEKLMGKRLFHPPKFCINRPTYPKSNGRQKMDN